MIWILSLLLALSLLFLYQFEFKPWIITRREIAANPYHVDEIMIIEGARYRVIEITSAFSCTLELADEVSEAFARMHDHLEKFEMYLNSMVQWEDSEAHDRAILASHHPFNWGLILREPLPHKLVFLLPGRVVPAAKPKGSS